MSANATVPASTVTQPTAMSGRGPRRSSKRPVTGFITPIMMAPGRSVRPDTVAESPWISCTNSGTMIDGAMNIMCAQMTISVETANVLSRKHCSLRNGSGTRS